MVGKPAVRSATSRYNFHVPVKDGVLLYNANTGAVLRLLGVDALELAQALSGRKVEISEEILGAELYAQLSRCGFVVPVDHDEIAVIRERYHRARRDTPIVLTITTTLDCNLGCYYCYEERSQHRLEAHDIPGIVEFAEERLAKSGKQTLHIDWYGGEPLMNIEFMEATSLALQSVCVRRGVKYAASVISNGTCWPNNVGDFVVQHRIQQVQVSFDGLREHHDRRRHYRSGYAPTPDDSSFERAVGLVDKLLDYTRVDIRLNVDRRNSGDVIPFVRFARARGWFGRAFSAKIQLARLAAYSERSGFMRNAELSLDEYDALRGIVRGEVGSEVSVEESEAPDGFPFPKTSVCAALANDSSVLGADAKHYRCGLQVAEPHRAVGQFRTETRSPLTILDNLSDSDVNDAEWWMGFDPTILPTCSRCSFLPICWAGCPKKHLEADTHAIAEQGRYWRKNLARLISSGAGVEPEDGFEYSETEQFR
jgi:uncharacterized protein